MSFFGSISGFAGILPVLTVRLNGVGSPLSGGVESQQLLPQGADFASMARGLGVNLNVVPEYRRRPSEAWLPPLDELESTLEHILGAPVTIEPLASRQGWGLFEVHLEVENYPASPFADLRLSERKPESAPRLLLLTGKGDTTVSPSPVTGGNSQIQIPDAIIPSLPFVLLLAPAKEGSTASVKVTSTIERMDLPEDAGDTISVPSLKTEIPAIDRPLGGLDQATPDAAAIERAPALTNLVEVSPKSDSENSNLASTPAALATEEVSIALPPETDPVPPGSNETAPEPSTRTFTSPLPFAAADKAAQPTPDKIGLAQVAQHLRRPTSPDGIAPNPQKPPVEISLKVPPTILEALTANALSNVRPESAGMEPLTVPLRPRAASIHTMEQTESALKPIPQTTLEIKPSDLGAAETLFQKSQAAPEAKTPSLPVWSPPSPNARVEMMSLTSQTAPVRLPAVLLDGEQALKISALAVKVLSPPSEGSASPATAETEAPGNLLSERPGLVSSKPNVRPPVPFNSPVSPQTATALIQETENRVSRSILSTFFSNRVRSPEQPTHPKPHPAEEKQKPASTEKPALFEGPKSDPKRDSLLPRPEPRAPESPIPLENRQTKTSDRTSLAVAPTLPAAPAAAAPTPVSSTTSTGASTLNLRNLEVVEQVSHALRSNRGPIGSEVRIRLVPEHLGEVHLKITMKAGTLVAEIRASSEVTREILSREAGRIQALLGEAGPKIEHVVIRTGGFGGETFEANRSSQREPNLPADRESGRNGGRDGRDSGSSQQEKGRDPHTPWERWERFA